MIRVGKMADYAIVILEHLGRHRRQKQSVDSIAQGTRLATATVRKVMNQLVNAELVNSHRGPHGGYELAKPLAAISLLDAISAIEGPMALTDCCAEAPDCDLLEGCDLREKWPSINHILEDTLRNISVSDLIHPQLRRIQVQHQSTQASTHG